MDFAPTAAGFTRASFQTMGNHKPPAASGLQALLSKPDGPEATRNWK